MKRQTMYPRGRLLLALLATTACSSNWQPVTLAQPPSLDRRTVLEFQAKNQLVRLHGVEFTRDSVSGIPWLEHLSCDTCRVRYAFGDISQARTGDPGKSAWIIAAPMLAFLAAMLGFAIALAIDGGGGFY